MFEIIHTRDGNTVGTSTVKPELPGIPSLPMFYDMLERFDWYYTFSDDGGVYRAGDRRMEELSTIAKQGGDAYTSLMAAWSNHMFSGESWGTERAPKPARPEVITAEDASPYDDYPDGTDVEEMRVAEAVAKDHMDAWVGLQTIEMALTGSKFSEMRSSEQQVKDIVQLITEWKQEIVDLKDMLKREYQTREDVRVRHMKMRRALERMISGDASFTLSKVRRILLEDV